MSTLLPLLPDDPDRLGEYTLLGRLGGGGMGTVFLARTAGGRLAAVKTVRSELRDQPGYRQRLTLEAEAARALGAEHTAAFLGADPGTALPWLATAYLIGPSLTEAVTAGGPLPEPVVRGLGSALAAALATLHRAGLVHRDVKPSNVLITAQGPRLIDFGLAQAPGSPRLTQAGGLAGTPAYMSPEQARGGPPGPEGDVFALAAVLLFAAAGHGPYDARGRQSTLELLRDGADPDLTGLPDGLRETLTACLSPEPGDRPSPGRLARKWGPFDPDEFAELLPQALLADLSRRIGELATVATAPLRAPAPRRAFSRRTLIAGSAAAALTAAGGASALWATGNLPGSGTGSGPADRTAAPGASRSSRPPGTPPAPLWSVPSPFSAASAVASDEVLIHTSDVLRGISTADGRILWETQTAKVDVAVVGDRLVGFVFDDDGNASAGYLDPRTGHLAADAANPAVLGDLTQTTQLLAADAECLYLRAYFRSNDRQQEEQAWLLSYELNARKLRWRTRIEGAVLDSLGSLMMSSVISGGRLICSDPARVFAVDLRDGRVLWACRVRTDQEATSPDQSGVINPPVVSDRHVLDFEERITAVDLVTGAVAWRLEPEGTKLLSAPVCVNGTVYAADGALQAFDESTGKKVWTHDPGAYVSMLAPPAPFRGELYAAVVGDGQAVVAVDVAARRTAWTLAAGAVNMPEGPTMIVQRGNRLYPHTVDRIAAVPLD
ncbi:PQQ-binding-like beta-propeller repeat protein [Streptomyces sp. H27-H1]|uniref:protein kinase domain-containing protein n=1 Tax=Streptomyces sp. H27-H1 TaxID=2996461 RepID=UPI002270C6DB|nr:PQQ-binding-like beta-propeller repeat protein [Streptomyces sp. H27-H1]MCY0931793.1 PQQ-binding-like beta-propeller repeat protein [Streptomyces sp. H27-H1]